MSHLNIAFDRYTSIGTVMHYILVISVWTGGIESMRTGLDTHLFVKVPRLGDSEVTFSVF